MEQTVSSSLLVHKHKAVFTVFFFLTLFLPLTGSAQTTDTLVEYDYTKEISDLTNNYDQILDYQDSKRCIAYSDKEKLNCITFEDTIIYLYKTDLTPSEDVVTKNTVKISDNTFKIYGSDAFYQDEQTGAWKQTEYGVVEKNDFQAVQDYELKNADEISFLNNPFKIYKVNAQIYSSSGDGRVYGSNANWATVYGASTGDAADYTTASLGIGTNLSGGTYYIRKGFLVFDTSSLSGTVASSSVFLTPNSSQGTNETSFHITSSDQPSNSVLTTDDFNNVQTTSFGSVNTADMANNTTERFVLNSTGNEHIDVDGYTLFGLIDSAPLTNTAPAGLTHIFNFYFSEQTGTNYDPYILVDVEEEEEPEEPTATTTLSELPDLPLIDDLTIITGLTEHYETNTTTPDWIEYHYYRIPAILYWILSTFFLFILGFILSQIQRILRKKK